MNGAAGQIDQLPGPSLRAIYRTKAIALGFILAILASMKVLLLPEIPLIKQGSALFLAFATTVAIYSYSRNRVSSRLLAAGFASDIFAVTAGIHFGGGIDNTSGVILYALIIGLAGLIVSERAAYFAWLGCSFCYATMDWLERANYLPHNYPFTRPDSLATATVVACSVYLFVVCLVTGFAARQLRALHRRANSLRDETLGARSVTILFGSDVGLFVRAAEVHGDSGAMRFKQARDAIVRTHAQTHGAGYVDVHTDSFMVAFARAEDALHCAFDIRDSLTQLIGTDSGHGIELGVGLHTGEAFRTGERFFGKTVILASRIAALARNGEILVSSRLRDLASEISGLQFGDARMVRMKGLADTYAISDVVRATG